jgi:hypothetical protein
VSIRITLLVEGATEVAFKPILRKFLDAHLSGRMPRLDFFPYDGRIPKEDRLRGKVKRLLQSGKADAVIALTDVYTGTQEFRDAKDAREKMRAWVGDEPRFYPHAAQHDFEAWLLPFWKTIQRLAGSHRSAPGVNPEQVNHGKPPAYHLKEIFRNGDKAKAYAKPVDAPRILKDADLLVAARACPELQDFLNTILNLYDLEIADGEVKERAP